jgi:uncharacterized repeat protein (TIGR04076 family)
MENAENWHMRLIDLPEEKQIGHRITGTIKEVKGVCSAGHKVGDRFELSGYTSGGLCGFFYHDIFPYIIMLQFGGGFPAEYGSPDVIEMECVDRVNAVKIELKRIKE